ncbi:F-box/kelch-repeat protein At3g23880-like [Vigna unguiculata]|uniref:F-box/kelch-repeat protein At3g23880-like n=1 Tax=Vigna unguiculata TaxID=3917 RepID=UPI001015EF00|nr:F-box/kelch-repeat protein At3g23880-like [Vigna unguiculata]
MGIKCPKMKTYCRRTKNTRHLPQELIIKILLRLPVKSLVRFKCVCKSWLSLISDSHFSLSHFEQTATRTERLVFFEPSAPEVRSIDVNAPLYDDSASAVLNLNFLPPKPYDVRIRGSCRGFVLLECCQSLWLWNPSTGVHKQLSSSPTMPNKDPMLLTFLFGFGYDSSTDDYLVVKVLRMAFSCVSGNRVEILSLRANAWKEIEGIHFSYLNCFNDMKVGLLFNGALHWVVSRYDLGKNVIVVFDLRKRSFSEIPLPREFDWDFNTCDLVVLGKIPRLCVVGCCSPAELWVMEEYKDPSSWTKTIVVSVDDIPTKYFSPICSTKCNDIVGIDGSTGLVKCSDKGQVQEHRYWSSSYRSEVAVYKETLVTLLSQRRFCFSPYTLQVAVYTESLHSLPYEC